MKWFQEGMRKIHDDFLVCGMKLNNKETTCDVFTK